ncbi:MAG: dihydrolipoamide acetyltransferase family protein [Bacillota bacterium]
MAQTRLGRAGHITGKDVTQLATQVIMPKLGLTMTQGKVVKWLVAEGEAVSKGQTVVQITTEKIANVVEAPAEGIVRKILAPAGTTVPVLAPLAVIAGGDEDISDLVSAAKESSARPLAVAAQAAGGEQKVSPVARKLAEEAGLDLAGVTGSGPGGRILREDVERAISERAAAPAAQQAAPAVAHTASPAARRLAAEQGIDLAFVKGTGPGGRILTEDVERCAAACPAPRAAGSHPADEMRLTIARRMFESLQTTAQSTLTREVNASELVRFREAIVVGFNRDFGVKLTYTDLFLRAVALALRAHPGINVSFDGQSTTVHAEINLGVAVDLGDNGLIVPVLRDAGTLSLPELSRRVKTLVENARAGTLSADDIAGGTFTVTNLGMYGVDAFTPVLNPPESAILGIGRIAARPMVSGGVVVPGQSVVLSLTHDHRVIDGAPAARFVETVARFLEAPYTLLALGG